MDDVVKFYKSLARDVKVRVANLYVEERRSHITFKRAVAKGVFDPVDRSWFLNKMDVIGIDYPPSLRLSYDGPNTTKRVRKNVIPGQLEIPLNFSIPKKKRTPPPTKTLQ